MKVSNKRVLITGASSGLGEAIARRLVADGAKVAITARREERLRKLAGELGAHAIVADHTKPADNQRAIDEAVAALGGLDGLVLNAGVIGYDGVVEPNPAEFRRLMDINVFATYELLCLGVPHLVASAEAGRDAAVLAVSSIAGKKPQPKMIGYCTSKAAVDMMVDSAAIELAPKKVRVNAINPGVVVTELHTRAGLGPKEYEAFLERCKTSHPLGRPGTAEEVAALAAFLLSDEASWITGEHTSIDGGRALTSLR